MKFSVILSNIFMPVLPLNTKMKSKTETLFHSYFFNWGLESGITHNILWKLAYPKFERKKNKPQKQAMYIIELGESKQTACTILNSMIC